MWNKTKRTTKKKGFTMKRKSKTKLKEAGKCVIIILTMLLLLAMTPYCKDFFACKSHIIVTDSLSISQHQIDEFNDETLIVEFKCDGSKFPNLLSQFIKRHQNFDLRIVETVKPNDPNIVEGFLVTFSKAQ